MAEIGIIFEWIKFIFVWFWWAFIFLWLVIMKVKMKKWQVEVVIIEKRGENLIKTNDRAGRFIDEFTGLTGYRLQKSKDTIPVYNFDWVLHNVSTPTNFFEKIVNILRGNIGTIFLYRYGSKQYKPINVKTKDGIKVKYQEILDENGKPVFIQVYQPLDPRDKLGALDFEVVDWDNMNFMVQEQRSSIERRRKKSDWIKQIAIPIIIIAAAVMISIIMIKFGFDYASKFIDTPKEAGPASGANVPVIGDLFNAPGQ